MIHNCKFLKEQNALVPNIISCNFLLPSYCLLVPISKYLKNLSFLLKIFDLLTFSFNILQKILILLTFKPNNNKLSILSFVT